MKEKRQGSITRRERERTRGRRGRRRRGKLKKDEEEEEQSDDEEAAERDKKRREGGAGTTPSMAMGAVMKKPASAFSVPKLAKPAGAEWQIDFDRELNKPVRRSLADASAPKEVGRVVPRQDENDADAILTIFQTIVSGRSRQ